VLHGWHYGDCTSSDFESGWDIKEIIEMPYYRQHIYLRHWLLKHWFDSLQLFDTQIYNMRWRKSYSLKCWGFSPPKTFPIFPVYAAYEHRALGIVKYLRVLYTIAVAKWNDFATAFVESFEQLKITEDNSRLGECKLMPRPNDRLEDRVLYAVTGLMIHWRSSFSNGSVEDICDTTYEKARTAVQQLLGARMDELEQVHLRRAIL
jgi:hypothetical protein